jgi:hypothetical protein
MRHSLATRAFMAVMGIWLSLVLSDSGLLHACSTGQANDPRSERAVVATGAVDHASGHHGGHDTTHPAPTPHQAPDQQPDHPAHHGPADCNCIGHCGTTDLTTLPHLVDFALAVASTRSAQPSGRPSYEVVAAWVDFVLPFSTAPPSVMG